MKVMIAGAVLVAYLHCGVLNALQCGNNPTLVRPKPIATHPLTKKHNGRRPGHAMGNPGALGCVIGHPLPPLHDERPIPAELFWVSPIPPVVAPQAAK
jgi:hypothetical protein